MLSSPYCMDRRIGDIRCVQGTMHIDFSRGVLEISCTGRESSRLAASTASLSGGERSYSTVAFIMALWSCVEVPFYFMDEFDVFMDNVNRTKVMGLLLDHALSNPARQFVFLTPQDASTATAGPNVKIHKMADPRP
ncbi:structural maintenance of chromosomes protein 6-like [Choristoneura fumiferana]|uniref:structural maintenance of chromosomes protein 6-like n=1 Tax=Choristoneura fumiferana TaxID=7141 RepID=UPI003D15D0BA